MGRGVNKVFLLGRLGADPETRYTSNGQAVTNVRLATNSSWKDRNTGENRESTEWHSVVFFRDLAEEAQELLRKGSEVYVEGSIRTRKWQDKTGQDRYTTEVIAKELCPAGIQGERLSSDLSKSDQKSQEPDPTEVPF